MGARWYSPVLGRFISPDSIVPRPGDPQSLNRYAYVRNSPIMCIDPSGHLDIGSLILGMGDQFFDDVSLGIWFSLNVEWPKYLGGPKKQPLYEMNTKLHEAYHTGLDKIFSRFDGSKVWSELTPEQQKEIITSLRDYNLKFKFDQLNGTNTLDALEKTLKDVGINLP